MFILRRNNDESDEIYNNRTMRIIYVWSYSCPATSFSQRSKNGCCASHCLSRYYVADANAQLSDYQDNPATPPKFFHLNLQEKAKFVPDCNF